MERTHIHTHTQACNIYSSSLPFPTTSPSSFSLPLPAPPPPPSLPRLSLSLQLAGAHTHTFATVVAVFITSVIGSAGCPQTLLLMTRRWCGGHQRTLSSGRHRVSQQPSPEKNRCRWTSGNISSKSKEKLKRKTECPDQKLNWQGTRLSCQEGSHVETSLPHGLCSTLRSEYTWHGGHKLEREARRDRRLFDETRASNVKVGARPTAVRNRVHATACWYAGLLGACRRYNGSPAYRPSPTTQITQTVWTERQTQLYWTTRDKKWTQQGTPHSHNKLFCLAATWEFLIWSL